jgi:hypothetical protein
MKHELTWIMLQVCLTTKVLPIFYGPWNCQFGTDSPVDQSSQQPQASESQNGEELESKPQSTSAGAELRSFNMSMISMISMQYNYL